MDQVGAQTSTHLIFSFEHCITFLRTSRFVLAIFHSISSTSRLINVGSVDVEEFKNVFNEIYSGGNSDLDKLEEVFAVFDSDSDGKISSKVDNKHTRIYSLLQPFDGILKPNFGSENALICL
jgi:Ca2+-binding EF-hand superfamily protein